MIRCLLAFLSIPIVRKFHSHDFLVKQSSTFCIWSFGLEPISIHRKQKKNIFVLSPMIVVRCVLYNCVGNLAWLIILFFLAAPEMLGLCGIRRLGVQGDLDLFHSVINRSKFGFIILIFGVTRLFIMVLTQIFLEFLQDAQSAINDLTGKKFVIGLTTLDGEPL